MTARCARGILGIAGICIAAAFLHAQTATPLQIVTDSLPPASVGVSYNQQLITTGGVCVSNGSASSTIDSGALPPGLSITSPASTEQWFLQGTPTTGGNFTFTVHLTWTHVRVSPFQALDCHEDAVKTLTLAVQGNGSPPPPPTSATLAADRSQIATTYHIGTFPPAADTVQVTASGGAAVPITAQSVTDAGGPWMSVTALSPTTPAALSISYSIGGLAQGTYTGRVTVTTGGLVALTIPVTLTVVTDTNIQLLSTPSSLVFVGVLGSPNPSAQSITVTVAGANRLFQATVSAPPNGKWLTVTPSAAATKATLIVAVTAKDLAAAVYNGVITLAVEGIPNSSVTIPVTFTITAPTPVQKPTIAAGGVVDAAGLGPAIAPGTWVSLFGTSLSATTRAWRDADFLNGRLPTSLDGVSVTINGKPAAIAFISPLQINVLAADDTATGLVPVQVKNALGSSDSVLVLQQTAAPALFQLRAANANYAAATHADGSLLAGPALVQQGFPGTAARTGETIVLYGTGFGATQPPISATALVPAPLFLAHPEDLRVRIGGLDAAIAFAGLISPGVYQFNVVVPQIGEGDQPVVAELRGLLTQSNLLLTIQR
jgi:uncharacterized protein (TIGR03437 family)